VPSAEIARKFAPLVVLHRGDKLRPSSAARFVQRSALRWATGANREGEPVPGTERRVEQGRLGAASGNPYRVGRHLASAFTRPLDDNPARLGDPPLEQGFFLRLRNERHARGDKSASPDRSLYTGTPAYWDWDDELKAMTYWLFYPGSSPPLGILRAHEQIGTRAAPGAPPDPVEAAEAAATLEEFRRAYPSLAAEAAGPATRGFGDVFHQLRVVAAGVHALLREDDVLHEGDWERVTVYLDRADPVGTRPESVVFYRHGTNTPRAWGSVERSGTHPVAYCAIGSHASLPSPDFGFIDVGDRDGPRWRTWDDLRRVEDEPWYGFGGAWGRLGKVTAATGPLGPGAHWKHPAPRPAV
jgi:hypothetical protein